VNKKVSAFIISITVCLSAGGIGSIFTFQAIPTWYQTLNKPFFTPPSWLFGPVWTTLYVLMGISLGIVWRLNKSAQRTNGIRIFALQIALNAFWSIAFFGLRSPLFGLIVIIPLWLAILQTIRAFKKLSAPAANLLIPYLLWVSFATFLNLAIFLLNSSSPS
jgi:tryptophan-rich sensory protein